MYYKQINKLIDPIKAKEMADHMDDIYDPLKNLPDPTVPMSPAFHNIFCKIHVELTPIIAREWSVNLVPSYNYGRIYNQGDILTKHLDRPSCEYSITLNLSRNTEIWPFYVKSKDDKNAVEVLLDVGDAVTYKGPDVLHWREELPDGKVHQMFFHWVSTSGRFAELAWDNKRESFKAEAEIGLTLY
tara:strand:- start:93 stop:650 length:558 start_codon:yes stop_codon:yes gene_type:complete